MGFYYTDTCSMIRIEFVGDRLFVSAGMRLMFGVFVGLGLETF